LSSAQLRHWAKWTGGVDLTLERAQTAVAKCRDLLRPENLAPFAALLSEFAEQSQQFKAFLASLDTA
jgi:hypothetical protein